MGRKAGGGGKKSRALYLGREGVMTGRMFHITVYICAHSGCAFTCIYGLQIEYILLFVADDIKIPGKKKEI